MSDSPRTRRPPHAGVCECALLAGAVGCDPAVISFHFCDRVLQRHWRMTCGHRSVEDDAHAPNALHGMTPEAASAGTTVLMRPSRKKS